MSIRKVMLVLALSAILAAPAFAAEQQAPAQGGGAPQGGAPQGQAAAQSDGVTLDVTPFFTAVDTNKDGKITADEWKAAGLPDNVFTMFETDKKGYIVKESLSSKKHPPTVDSNKDGKLSVDELKAHIKSQSAGGGQGGAAPGGAAPAGAAPAGASKK